MEWSTKIRSPSATTPHYFCLLLHSFDYVSFSLLIARFSNEILKYCSFLPFNFSSSFKLIWDEMDLLSLTPHNLQRRT